MHRLILVIFLIVGIIFSVYLVLQNTSLFSKASPDIAPKNVTVSNISDSSITLSWVTDKETIGFVKYAEDASLNQTEYDERDENGPKMRNTHFVVLKNLTTQKKYYFKIVSQDQVFGDGEKPFEQLTASISEDTPPVPVLTFGKLKKIDGNIPKEAVIYLKLPNSTPITTYTEDEGNYLLTVTNARKADLSSYLEVKDGDEATIWADGGLDGSLSNTQIKINSSKAMEDLILEEPVNPAQVAEDNTLRDFNNDGLINAHDFAIMIKRILKL